MINNIISFIRFGKKNEAKEIILKEFFNYSDQKKAINKAARESAEDQKNLIERYNSLIRLNQKSSCSK